MNHWLVKQEPEDYPFSQLVADGHADWTGVRNFQARNNLRAMKKGDRVLYYHSGDSKSIVGTATVSREAFLDPTVEDDDPKGEWYAVELAAGEILPRPLTLAEIKSDPKLGELPLIRHTRLSVMPVHRAEFDHILRLTHPSP